MMRLALFSPAAALVFALAGCGGDLSLPGPTAASVSLAVLQGDGQTGTVGQPLPNPVVVVVRTGEGAPMPDRRVVFVDSSTNANDAFDPDTAITNGQGQALTHWVLGTTPGAYAAVASVIPQNDTVAPAIISASAVAGAPDSVRAVGPTSQTGHREQPVDQPLVVAVVDRFGNPVPGVQVKWNVERGSGSLSPSGGTITDADGRSSVTWTLGTRIGLQQATAEVEDVLGSPVTFSATVLF